jgi:hypothetical protein
MGHKVHGIHSFLVVKDVLAHQNQLKAAERKEAFYAEAGQYLVADVSREGQQAKAQADRGGHCAELRRLGGQDGRQGLA